MGCIKLIKLRKNIKYIYALTKSTSDGENVFLEFSNLDIDVFKGYFVKYNIKDLWN